MESTKAKVRFFILQAIAWFIGLGVVQAIYAFVILPKQIAPELLLQMESNWQMIWLENNIAIALVTALVVAAISTFIKISKSKNK